MLEKRVRLTKDSQDKIIKIEIYVDKAECCEIFKYFPDKIIEWKEAAPHVLILRGLAGYEKKKLTTATQSAKNDSVDELAALVKNLCHKTAPLYALINHPYLDDPFHPAKVQWETFIEKYPHLNKMQVKIEFIKSELLNYQQAVKALLLKKINLSLSSQEEIQKFYQSHQEETAKFIKQLDGLANSVLDEDQLRKLLSNQDEANILGITSLGQFLRSQAHELAGDTLSALDDVTAARFDQLFSFSAHPLRKELVRAKKAIGDQESTHAVRFLNTRLPIPPGQLAVLENDDSKSEKKWFDIMPYVNCKTFLGNGIEGAEGLDDVDQILAWYANGAQPIKKPHSKFYKKLIGKEGAVGIFEVVFFGLPALMMAGVGLVAGACLAMVIDLMTCFLQALVFVFCSPLLLLGVIVDFVLQIPSFVTQKIEIPFSFLAKIAKLNIPPEWLNRALRKVSVVRIFKQFLLNDHDDYEWVDKTIEPESFSCIEQQEGKQVPPENASKADILHRVRENQAEGLFNVAASKLFAFSNVAGFLHEKLKQFFYAVRELRKVLGMLCEITYHFFLGEAGRVQEKQRQDVIGELKKQIVQKNVQLSNEFLEALEEWGKTHSGLTGSFQAATEKDIAIDQDRKWPCIVPWSSRQINSPLDFISDIAAGAVGTVDFAFMEDPGIATPMFVLAMLGFGALLFPSVAGVIPAQVVNGAVAKAFMGKTLETGLPGIVTNILSNFLQWQLTTYGLKGFMEVYHGNFEWVRKLFEYPEEITLGATTFISLGYGMGLIPNLPTGVSLPTSPHPFLNALATYPATVYNGFASAFNVVINESREVTAQGVSGLNTLELAFIGLKSSLLIYGLLSGGHEAQITPLKVNFKKLVQDYCDAGKERLAMIQTLLHEHKIADPDSALAKKIHTEFSELAAAISVEEWQEIDLGEDRNKPSSYPTRTPTPEEQIFVERYKALRELLEHIRDMEVLGMPIDLFDKNSQNIAYQSKKHAELIYDALFFAIEDYNQAARQVGLFHEQLDGRHFLHNFYNKHCYAGSSGWHKILFGILLFPVTWLWRGFKYLIGTPSMQHQVKKSFCKDFAMLFQLIPDVIAPILRSFLKAVTYSIRMFLGVFLLPLLVVTGGIMLFISGLALVGILPMSLYALAEGIQTDSAEKFAEVMIHYFTDVKKWNDAVWQTLLCNPFVNSCLKEISFVGSTSGTGSPHRLNLLKTVGLASLYEYLTSVADTSSENLQRDACQLSARLAKNPADFAADLIEARDSNSAILDALAQYDKDAKDSWRPISSERPTQLAYLAESFSARHKRSLLQPVDKNINSILNALDQDPGSRLAEKLKTHGVLG